MMRLPEFKYVAARTVQDAAGHLAEDPGSTRLVAGGTDLWPNMKRRHRTAKTVIGLRAVKELAGVRTAGADALSVGAMTSLSQITRDENLRAAYPGFVQAVASISTPVLRNMGTIGGNLALDTRCTYYNQNEEWRRAIGYCMKEVGSTCWVRPSGNRCYAISATDSAPVLCAMGARVKLVSTRGERVVPLDELYRDDGIDYLCMQRDEILTELLLPPARGLRSIYWKLRRRGSIDFPVLGVGIAFRENGNGAPRDLEIFLGGIESRPHRMSRAAEWLRDKPLDEASVARAAQLAKQEAATWDNTDFELGWRLLMVERYVEGALRELAHLPQNMNPRATP